MMPPVYRAILLVLQLACVGCASAAQPTAMAPQAPVQSTSAKEVTQTLRKEASLRYCLTVAADLVAKLEAEVAYRRFDLDGRPCFGPFRTAEVARSSRAAHPALGASEVRTLVAPQGPVWLSEPVAALGNLSFIAVGTAPEADVVVVHLFDTFETEPGPGALWVLDGARQRVHYEQAVWDAVVTADGAEVLFGRAAGVAEADPELAEQLPQRVAHDSGLPLAEVLAGAFHNGFTDASLHLVQPVVLDLSTGRSRAMPITGGGAFGREGLRVYTIRRPRYWAFEHPESEVPPEVFELLPRTLESAVVPPARASAVRALVEQGWFERREVSQAIPDALSAAVAATRGGRLALRTVTRHAGTSFVQPTVSFEPEPGRPALERAAVPLSDGSQGPSVPGASTAGRSQRTVLSLPFDGVWTVSYGYRGSESHRGYAAFALDLVKLDARDRAHIRSGLRRRDWYSYGAELLATADGVVVQAIDDRPDNPVMGHGQAANTGIIQHAADEFSEYVHLRRGSLRVSVGDHVRRGQVLARAGNSGAQTPHLHWALLSSVQPIRTRPAVFAHYERRDRNRRWVSTQGLPLQGDVIRAALPDRPRSERPNP